MLDAIDLHHRFGGVHALRGVTVAFPRGRVTVVLGPNGAGKSTLLRLLADVLRPHSGEIRLDGDPLRRLHRRQRAASIGYVAQRPLFASALSVRTVVELGRIAQRDGRAGLAAVAAALTALRLEADADRPVTALSVGQQQRVSIARMLAQTAGESDGAGPPTGQGRPAGPYLLLDEPFAALDPAHVRLVLELLRERAAAGCGVVAVVHDLPAAAALADDVVVLVDGRVAASGSAADVLVPETLERLYGLPFQRAGEVVMPVWRRRSGE